MPEYDFKAELSRLTALHKILATIIPMTNIVKDHDRLVVSWFETTQMYLIQCINGVSGNNEVLAKNLRRMWQDIENRLANYDEFPRTFDQLLISLNDILDSTIYGLVGDTPLHPSTMPTMIFSNERSQHSRFFIIMEKRRDATLFLESLLRVFKPHEDYELTRIGYPLKLQEGIYYQEYSLELTATLFSEDYYVCRDDNPVHVAFLESKLKEMGSFNCTRFVRHENTYRIFFSGNKEPTTLNASMAVLKSKRVTE